MASDSARGTSAQLRSSVVKASLAALERVSFTEAQRLRAALTPETRALVENSGRMDWLPIEVHLELTEKGLEVLSASTFRAARREATLQVARSPLLGSVLSGALNLFGSSALALFRMVPRVYGHTTRGLGTVQVLELGDDALCLEYRGLPERVATSPGWRAALVVDNEAVFELASARGSASMEDYVPGSGRVRLTVKLLRR